MKRKEKKRKAKLANHSRVQSRGKINNCYDFPKTSDNYLKTDRRLLGNCSRVMNHMPRFVNTAQLKHISKRFPMRKGDMLGGVTCSFVLDYCTQTNI